MRKLLIHIVLFLIAVFFIGLILPQRLVIPVADASQKDWNNDTFWHYPWGQSVTHKGVDIFAEKGRKIVASTSGIVVFKGDLGRGGNTIIILGPRWRLHYYAHLDQIEKSTPRIVRKETNIGTVGNTGNAANTPPHLHYGIFTPIPHFWLADKSIQGWKKMFYLNPLKYLTEESASNEVPVNKHKTP